MNSKKGLKFEFTLDFQHEILKFIATDVRFGFKVVEMLDDEYFDLLEDAVIMRAFSKFFKTHNRVPSKTLLIEELNYLYQSRDFADKLLPEDRKNITTKAKKLYDRVVQDGDIIYNKIKTFKKFVLVSHQVENTDLKHITDYEKFVDGIQASLKIDDADENIRGSFLIADVRRRQRRRQENNSIIPFPFKQLNKLTNAGGAAKNGVFVLLDEPKKFKTGMLANLAKGYMKMRKKVVIFDLENGEDDIFTRLDQSVSKLRKKDILSGDHDQKLQKIYRKYKRMGAEIYVERLPNLSTTRDMQRVLDDLYRDYGFLANIIIIDYVGLMGSLTGSKDETERISQAYLDVANMAKENDIDHIWTANHVKRDKETFRRSKTKYHNSDIAKCIDIVRHVQGIFGLNRTEEEIDNNYLRLEIVEQRDGVPTGRALFHCDVETQYVKELTKSEEKEYYEIINPYPDANDNRGGGKFKSRIKDSAGSRVQGSKDLE